MVQADYWITNLKLQAHPEGGFYRETYRAAESIHPSGLPERFADIRSFSTAIYFLLTSYDRSLFHRIKSDELWHYHTGSSLSIYVLNDSGLTVHKLGPNVEQGESFQAIIPAGCWFGAMVEQENGYTLSSCTVSPGFDFQDFEMADRATLLRTFPACHRIIEKLTK